MRSLIFSLITLLFIRARTTISTLSSVLSELIMVKAMLSYNKLLLKSSKLLKKLKRNLLKKSLLKKSLLKKLKKLMKLVLILKMLTSSWNKPSAHVLKLLRLFVITKVI